MQPITYKLNPGRSAFSTYYLDVASFTDDVLVRSRNTVMPIAESYTDFLKESRLEDYRTVEEYVYELLNLGVLWRSYGNTALAVQIAPFSTMAHLGEWRKTHPRLKPAIDFLRGILLSFFLVPIPCRRTDYAPQELADIERLVTWLEATGDFREDAFRYIRLLAYLSMFSAEEFSKTMKTILTFADWFEDESTLRMGGYTPNVDGFVERNLRSYRWRIDRFTCLRSRTEYHLSMIGTEIMNRAHREEFDSCGRKTVLAPGCMRARSERECKGVKSPKGIRCAGCESRCHINQLREMGVRDGFDVMIIPHSADLSQWSAKPGNEPMGVVGVACLSVLVQGGWELKRNNVPAQCVLLNQCGCKSHWHEEGFPTEIDLRALKQIVVPSNPPSLTYPFKIRIF
ncbi:MAG: DUF116 domain-containing protein [Ignavibacteriales bacterium]|nr:DUF116 domain-containing protein [Ignavibacteriales bacterium]